MNDFSNTIIETPNTAMAFDPSDVPVVQPQPDYPGTPATVDPNLPETTAGGYEGPIGVTGVIDNITTGCEYSPLSHNNLRAIDDIVVPGSIGKYPLKMTRYYNGRSRYWDYKISLSPGWSHQYSWLLWTAGYKVISPQGNVHDFSCGQQPLGISEGWDDGIQGPHANGGIWRLADGGRVHFSSGGLADYIEDPYGLRTTITRDVNSRVSRVTEPGQRYLQFTYGTGSAYTDPAYGNPLLKKVEAYDGQGHLIESVTYTYTDVDSGGVLPDTGQHVIRKMLTGVAYDDNTSASYTYRTDNVPDHPLTPPYTFKWDPLLEKCNDKRYSGPMRQIFYEYDNGGQHGTIQKERKDNASGPLVSRIEPDPLPPGGEGWVPYAFTETRGDGPPRTFTYTQFKIYPQRPDPQEFDPCLDVDSNVPPQQMLDHFTDFNYKTTWLEYDGNWYIHKVTDANGNQTQYDHDYPPSQGHIGEIKKITHLSDNTYIQYTYDTETNALDGHYIHTIRDENGKTTTITRDATRHWITGISYPSDTNTPASSEAFGYNGFGQITVHQLKNGAWERFAYDIRGLLTDKWNPKQGALPADGDPHTHYDYYTAADGIPGWIDRVKKVTMPANYPWNFQATETYEYDNNASGAHCAGRGLVTKITHTDGSYQSFKYDQWGNKVKEWNENGERTDSAYDGYNRVTSVTRANETTTYDYSPTEGGQSYLHTTNSPYWVTAPTGVKTHNVYDENWRKTLSTDAYGTTKAANTSFIYDDVGNLRYVTDPNSHTTETDYDLRNRKWHVWDALRNQTTFGYDNVTNIIDVLRPDTQHETKTYDALNRVITSTVPFGNDPASLTTWFIYNPSGTLQKVTDARGTVGRTYPNGDPNYTTAFEYDASDQKMKMTYPDGSFQRWDYDDAHNMKTRATVSGKVKTFAYDNRNRLYADSWGEADGEWRYLGLDFASRLRATSNGPGVWFDNVHYTSAVHRIYDTAGRLTWEEQTLPITDQTTIDKTINYEYNATLRGAEGKPTRMYASEYGTDYDFRYDEMGRFEKILAHNASSPLFQYYYDPASNETQRRGYLSDTATVDQFYNPDELNRIGKVELKKNNASFAYEDYDYYPIGWLHSITRQDNKQDQFGYYNDGELYWAMYGVTGVSSQPDANEMPPADDPAKEKTPEDFLSLSGWDPNAALTADRTVTYTYDKAGNRTGVGDTVNGSVTYTPNKINQYTGNIGADAIGNGSEHAVSSYKNVSYTYLKDEHLIGVSSVSPNNTYQLAYDPLGRCIKRTINGVTKYYIYDGERPILEYKATGSLAARNLYGKGIDEILMRYDPTLIRPPATTFYYQQDHEGSVTHLVKSDGSVFEKYRYDAFGTPTIYDGNGTVRTSSAVSNRFLFTGREYNGTFGFYEYRARAYHPALGRFISEDPKLFVRRAGLGKAPNDWTFGTHPDEAEFNLFRYCDNDPVDFTDPMGLDSLDVKYTSTSTPVSAPGQRDVSGYVYSGTMTWRSDDGKALASYQINSGGYKMADSKVAGKEVPLFPGKYSVDNLREDRGGLMRRDGVGFSLDVKPKFSQEPDKEQTLTRIHSDGGEKGTHGCIGVWENADKLRDFVQRIKDYFTSHKDIELKVRELPPTKGQ